MFLTKVNTWELDGTLFRTNKKIVSNKAKKSVEKNKQKQYIYIYDIPRSLVMYYHNSNIMLKYVRFI